MLQAYNDDNDNDVFQSSTKTGQFQENVYDYLLICQNFKEQKFVTNAFSTFPLCSFHSIKVKHKRKL